MDRYEFIYFAYFLFFRPPISLSCLHHLPVLVRLVRKSTNREQYIPARCFAGAPESPTTSLLLGQKKKNFTFHGHDVLLSVLCAVGLTSRQSSTRNILSVSFNWKWYSCKKKAEYAHLIGIIICRFGWGLRGEYYKIITSIFIWMLGGIKGKDDDVDEGMKRLERESLWLLQ